MRHIITLAAILALAFTVTPALAGKGGNGKGNGNAASAPTLVATPNEVHIGQSFDVAGCGYDLEYGAVIVGFAGGSWGSPLDSNGCFAISGIPALSGDALQPGTYEVAAYQYVHNGKLRKTGETTVNVVP